MGKGDRRRVDARAGLELPKRLAGVLVERDELTRGLAREQEPAAGGEHSRRTRNVGQRYFPLALSGERIERNEVADHLAGRDVRLPGDHAGRLLANLLHLRGREFLDAREVPRRRIDQAFVRVERDRHRVRAARWIYFDLVAGQEVLVDAGELRATGREVDAGGPVDLSVGMRGDWLAGDPINYVHVPVFV